jgi:hypothetical protein
MDGKKMNPFENKGNAVSDSEIKHIVDHPGGEWGPSGDHSQETKPPEDLKSE